MGAGRYGAIFAKGNVACGPSCKRLSGELRSYIPQLSGYEPDVLAANILFLPSLGACNALV